MELFKKFLLDLKKYSEGGIALDIIRHSISRINQFFYQTYPELGSTTALNGEVFEYFSEFHKFWEKHHKEILNPKIDDEQCSIVADILHGVLIKYGKPCFYELYNTHTLIPKE